MCVKSCMCRSSVTLMGKRIRDENEQTSNADNAPVAKVGKPTNIAYGEYNKAGVSIPCTDLNRPKLLESERKSQLRVVAWNLNGMRAFMSKRSDELRRLWKNEDVDILGISEHKITEVEKTVEIEAQIRSCCGPRVKIYWNMCKVKKGYSGTCAIVRESICVKNVTYGLNGSEDSEGRVITLELENFAVLIAYVPNSGQTLDRLKYRISTWDSDFAKHALNLQKKGLGVIIAGDLNVAHRDMDIWNVDAPHVPKGAGTTPQERASFQKQLLDRGFSDTFADMHPSATGWFTYHSVRAGNKPKNRGLRLDYVLSDRKPIDAYITCEYALDGDHCPVGATFQIPT